MSYYVSGGGDVTIRCKDVKEANIMKDKIAEIRSKMRKGLPVGRGDELTDIASAVCQLFCVDGVESVDAKTLLVCGIYEYGKWEPGDYEDILSTIAGVGTISGMCQAGCIEFLGEDGARWRYVFDGGKWHEEFGEIHWVRYRED